jgi:hypothetical protein
MYLSPTVGTGNKDDKNVTINNKIVRCTIPFVILGEKLKVVFIVGQ